MKLFEILIAIALCFTADCAHAQSKVENVQSPLTNEITEAENGQRILATGKIRITSGIVLSQNVIHSGSKNLTTYSLTIPSGTLVTCYSNNRGAFFKSPRKLTIHWNGFLGGDYPIDAAGIFVPNDPSQPTEIFYGSNCINPTAIEKHPDISFKREEVKEAINEGYSRELVYQGILKNVISILYREYIDGLIRSAYTEELKFDLTDGNEIGIKGARLEVIKANNLGITYKVTRPFQE